MEYIIIFSIIVIISLVFIKYFNKSSSRILLTDEFKYVIDLVEKSNYHIFITGKAGTGKSTLLKCLKDKTNKKIAIVAPTGIAALNVGGVTAHRFFQIPIPLNISNISKTQNRALYCNIDTIIIDEVSMLRVDIMDYIDKFLRMNGRDSQKPFGGLQIILIGDLYQLPPVVKNHELNNLINLYGGIYFFNAHVFKENNFLQQFKFVELSKIFRQHDITFINFLNNARINSVSNNDLIFINRQFGRTRNRNEECVYITPTNALAEQKNSSNLTKLPDPVFIYSAKMSGDFVKWEENQLPSPKELVLKKGAQVIFTKNGPGLKWVNGTIGIVKKLTKNEIFVQIKNNYNGKIKKNTINVPIEVWKNYKYSYSENELVLEVTGIFEQYPLKLAWAITIHKSQGQTLDKVVIDIGAGAFASGQTYVALSRCRSLEGIYLDTPLKTTDFISDPKISKFYDEMQNYK